MMVTLATLQAYKSSLPQESELGRHVSEQLVEASRRTAEFASLIIEGQKSLQEGALSPRVLSFTR